MIIFRIIANLFGIVSRLGFSLLWLPIFLVTRHAFVLIIVFVVALFYLFSSSDDQKVGSTANQNQPTMVRDEKGNLVQVATPVKRIENGNSAFANDLYLQMTPQEKAHYSQLFYWVMGNVPDGQTHSWSNVDIAGSMRPDNSFMNKSGERCRMFGEVLKVHAVQQESSGMACAKRDGTWCKLAANATPACGLGHNPGFMDGVSNSLKNIF